MNSITTKTIKRREFLKGTMAGLACLPVVRFSSLIGK